jgi:predicted amidohydrolase
MKPFSIAGIQMPVSAIQSNVPLMKIKLDVLMNVFPWVQMVVFSELCAFGPLKKHAQPFPNKVEADFQALAKKYGIWLIPGSIFQKKGEEILNTATVINPQGEIVGRYSKMFPFYPYEEGVTGGGEFLIWDVPEVGRFGMSICYDMWFPETSRTMAVKGVEVIIHPTLTGTLDRDIELSIVKATAAINQCYVIDVNGLGSGGIGRSIFCDPDGRVLCQAGPTDQMMPVEIDMELVRARRERGILGLGQPLKSFRDSPVHFDIYDRSKKSDYLDSLGLLAKPKRPI